VSTVDSGNLAGHLLTLVAGLNQLDQQPIFSRAIFSGLADTLDVLIDLTSVRGGAPPGVGDHVGRIREDLLDATPKTLSASYLTLRRLLGSAAELATAVQSHPAGELRWWTAAFENQCRFAMAELNHLAPWIELPPPTELMWA